MKTVAQWAGVAAIVVGALWLIVAFVSWVAESNSLAAQQLKEYRTAVEVCGADNIETHEYTNGTKDFDCDDYSQVKK